MVAVSRLASRLIAHLRVWMPSFTLMPTGLTCASFNKIEFCISHHLVTINSRLYKRVAAAFPVGYKMMAYPRGQIKSYGSCSRHIGTPFCWHQQNDTLGHKKSLRLEVIGETVAMPDSLLSSCNRWQKYEEYLEPPRENAGFFGKSAGNML